MKRLNGFHVRQCLRVTVDHARIAGAAFVTLIYLSISSPAYSAIFDIQPTDVTTRAASVVWVSDEPVLGAAVRVFSDANGTTEITTGLTLTVVSERFPPAHDNGIVKVDITGLTPNTLVYIQTETTTASGLIQAPATGPFIEIHTATQTTKANSSNQPIVNDLIRQPLLAPDNVTAAAGTLMLLKANGVSAYPVSAFSGEGGFQTPDAVVDMNNLFDNTGRSAEVLADQVIEITHYRGTLCASDMANQKLGVRRRAPAHTETPAITELENPTHCFYANLDCNETIDIGDIQALLNVFNSSVGSCKYNPNFDINSDGSLDIGDFQGILNQWNKTRPF